VDREGWERLHGGVPATAVVRVWLRLVQGLARGPVRRVPPDVLSLLGVLAAAGAWAVAPVLPLGTALLAVLAGVLDGLDGAVALRTGRARPLGAVVDAVGDRVGDLFLVAALVALGAPPPAAVALGAAVLLHEYLRARAQAAGMAGPGAVTVAERPTRIILVVVAGVGQAVAPAGTPWTGWGWAVVCVVIGLVAGAAGLVELAVAVLRGLGAR
jgi:archaetidylinositol phosphate synthase